MSREEDKAACQNNVPTHGIQQLPPLQATTPIITAGVKFPKNSRETVPPWCQLKGDKTTNGPGRSGCPQALQQGAELAGGTHLPLGDSLLLKASPPAAVIRPSTRDSSLRACSTAQECNLSPTAFLYSVSRGWLQLTLASLYAATAYSATALARLCFKVLLKTSADLPWIK